MIPRLVRRRSCEATIPSVGSSNSNINFHSEPRTLPFPASSWSSSTDERMNASPGTEVEDPSACDSKILGAAPSQTTATPSSSSRSSSIQKQIRQSPVTIPIRGNRFVFANVPIDDANAEYPSPPSSPRHDEKLLLGSLNPATTPLSCDSSSAYPSSFSESGSSCGNSYNSTLTPPAPGARPHLFSAKRFGQDVRRKNSKRRRRRRGDGKSSSASDINSTGSSALNLWKDEDGDAASSSATASASVDGSSDDETVSSQDELCLPFMCSTDELNESPQDKLRKYWEWCYGKIDEQVLESSNKPLRSTWSAQRTAPAKGCLSSLRPIRTLSTLHSGSTTPQSSSARFQFAGNDSMLKPRRTHRVQFGSPQAAEYEIGAPAGKLTPLPNEEARRRYSMDVRPQTEQEEEINQETKLNTSVLAEWEDGFDEPRSTNRSRRRQRDRRSSQLFTPSPRVKNGTCSVEDEDYEPILPQISPSVIVMQELASMRMSSPEGQHDSASSAEGSAMDHEVCETTPDDKASSTTRLSVETLSDMSSQPSQLSPMTVDTASVMQSVNSSGAAMDVTPPPQQVVQSNKSNESITLRRMSSISAASTLSERSSSGNARPRRELTPPSSGVSLGSIHSVGGALESLHSPPSVVQLMAANKAPTHHSPMKESIGKGLRSEGNNDGDSHIEYTDIVSSLVSRPESEQEWDAASVYANLLDKAECNGALQALECLPRHILRSFVEHMESEILSDCGDENGDDSKMCVDEGGKQHDVDPISKDWKKLELEHLSTVHQKLQFLEEETEKDLDKIESVEFVKLPLSVSLIEFRIKKCKQGIAKIKGQIQHAETVLEVGRAVEGPIAAVACEAICHLTNFNLLEVSDERLVMQFQHIVDGVETVISYDIDEHQLATETIIGRSNHPDRLISQNDAAADFYLSFLNVIMDNVPKEVSPDDLQTQLLEISITYQRLALVCMDLIQLRQSAKDVSIQFPAVKVTYPNDLQVAGRYEVETWNLGHHFVPSEIKIGQSSEVAVLPKRLHSGLAFSWQDVANFRHEDRETGED